MKKKNLVSLNLFVVFILLIISVSLWGMFGRQSRAEAEESGTPLETYMNGNYTNMIWSDSSWGYNRTVFEKTHRQRITLKEKGHIPATTTFHHTLRLIYQSKNRAEQTKLKNLNIYKFKNKEDFNKQIYEDGYFGTAMHASSNGEMVWESHEIEFDLSYYKNGENKYTKKYVKKYPAKKDLLGFQYGKFLKENISENGLYVFHIRKAVAGAHYYSASKYFTAFENYIFAFQIGNDD